MSLVRPVVLCGGAGSRLWPASRPDRPKPLLPLVHERSMLSETVARFSGPDFLSPWVVCGAGHAAAVRAELPGVRALVEDRPRGTAAAIVRAASEADPDELLLAVPADHVVTEAEALREAVRAALGCARDGWIVTFGIEPTEAATGYGWIEDGAPIEAGVRRVARFVEKPDRATAEGYLAGGRHLWNSGMFLFRAGAMLAEVDRLAPALRGPEPPAVSVDVAILERTDRAAVLPVACGWSDVGTWTAVAAARQGASRGPVTIAGSPGTLVWSDGPEVAVFGAPGLIVVASAGGVLVASPSEADRCRTMAHPATERIDHGPGWEVERTRLAAGESIVVTGLTVVVSGRVGGVQSGPLPHGTGVAERASVVLTIRSEAGSASE